MAFVASLVGIAVLVRELMISDQAGYGIVILVLAAVCLLSMAALVTYSRTGWKFEGSKEEWGLAIGLNPSFILLQNKDFMVQTGEAELEDRKREDDYYRSRGK